MQKIKSKCFNCGCGFYPTRSDQYFCSNRCRYKYNHKGDLVLILKGKWFDMILSGEKTEEYREKKAYWEKRFLNYFGMHYDFQLNQPTIVWNSEKKNIIFRNGYRKDARQFTAECTIREGTGKEKWGALPNEEYYILTIHRKFGFENCIDMSPLDRPLGE